MKNNQTTTEAKIREAVSVWVFHAIVERDDEAEVNKAIDEIMQLIAQEKKALLEAQADKVKELESMRWGLASVSSAPAWVKLDDVLQALAHSQEDREGGKTNNRKLHECSCHQGYKGCAANCINPKCDTGKRSTLSQEDGEGKDD